MDRILNRSQHKNNLYLPERDGVPEIEGDIAVLSELKEQTSNVQEGRENKSIRVVLFILGGAMRGIYGGAQVQSLHNAQLTDGLKAVIGISTETQPRIAARLCYFGTAPYFLRRLAAFAASITRFTARRFVVLLERDFLFLIS
jgi:hypothetical protein